MCEIIFIVNIEAIFVCINRREMNGHTCTNRKRETRKLVEKKLAATPSTDDVLTSVYWEFSNQEYMSNDAFTLDIINYIEDNKTNWNPTGVAINSRKVCIV